MEGFSVEAAGGLAQVPGDAWDVLTGSSHPFVEYAFLALLEETGCVGPGTGWLPRHLLVWEGAGAARRLVGAAPCYLRSDSYGEYIFDWGWADAAQRSGIPYYPKLTIAVPFTPATGPRLLVHPEADGPTVRRVLARAARTLAETLDAWSIHALFLTPEDRDALVAEGFAPRLSYQFHWENAGYGSYDDYLAALTSKRRKETRRERREAAAAGLTLAVEPGSDLTDADWEQVYRCYLSTLQGRWGRPYLRPEFFRTVGPRLGDRLVLGTARRDGELVAMTLALRKGDTLYGRYWGSTEPLPSLHFELCYHRLIAYAIEQGLRLFEAGAQGDHKLARGFLPRFTHSAHLLRHAGLSRAVGDFLEREARAVEQEVAALAEHSPFRAEEGR